MSGKQNNYYKFSQQLLFVAVFVSIVFSLLANLVNFSGNTSALRFGNEKNVRLTPNQPVNNYITILSLAEIENEIEEDQEEKSNDKHDWLPLFHLILSLNGSYLPKQEFGFYTNGFIHLPKKPLFLLYHNWKSDLI